MIKRSLLIAVALATVGSPSSARSQAIITLDGLVRGENGGVARAQVSAVDSLTNERRTGLTNERGYFRLLDLSPGQYVVSVRAIGYSPLTQTVQLVVGQRTELEFALQRSPVTLETVEVEERRGHATEIQRMSVSTAVTEQEIRSLPLNTRNVMELASVAPGIRTFRPFGGRSLPAAGAMRDERAINLYLDGVELKNMTTGNLVGSPQFGSPLPADALQEFRIFVNSYDAEHTRGAAYVISAVTQRGTNQHRGSVFGFFQNGSLMSLSDFQREIPNFERPDFQRRQAGFTVRGPVVRDRLFYAASYELSDTEDFITVVPGRPGSDPTFWDEYAGAFKAPNRNHTGLVRLTYNADGGTSFDAIWSSRYMTGESGFGRNPAALSSGVMEAHESAFGQEYVVNTLKLRHRWLPTSHLANELSVHLVDWSHQDRPLVPGPALRYPTLGIGRANTHLEIDETRLHAADRLTYSIGSGPGSHLLKVGLEIGRVTAEQFSPTNGSGVFNFSRENGDPTRGLIAVGVLNPSSVRDAATTLSGWIAGGYANDEWHVTSRLVLNLGVRYDVEINTLNNRFTVPWTSDTMLSSRPELQGFLNRGDRTNDLDNVSPRVSFSWDVGGDHRAFLRGGFGIMYDRVPGFIAFNERRTATWRTYEFPDPGTLDPDELRNRVLSGDGRAQLSITLLPARMEAPENRQWSIGIGAQLTRGLTLNADYVAQDVRKVFASVNLNWVDSSQGSARRALTRAYGDIEVWGAFARATHRAFVTSLSYDPATGRRLHLAYTLASAKADWDGENAAVPAAHAGQYYVMQRTSGDERHRFVLSAIWTFPLGFGISTIATAASPRPYRTRTGQDSNKNGFVQDDWIDGRRYQVPSNAWRNWYRVVDVRLTKAIDVGRGARLSLIAEGFNVFNSENYASYVGIQRSPSGEPNTNFGSPNAIFATRQVQLGTRLEF